MTAVALLRELETRGIRLVLQGDRLSLRGPGEALTADLTDFVRQHKPALLEAVRRCPTCTECGAAIVEPITTWWGDEPVHYLCGISAWRREWKGETPARAAE